mgnify:FL=1|jgi:Myb-like DNA-binding domain.
MESISDKESNRDDTVPLWDPAYDELLYNTAIKCKNHWKRVSNKIFKILKVQFPPKILRIRYKALLCYHKRDRLKFTHQEDLTIVKSIQKFGLSWTKISLNLPARTPLMIKNRYYSYIRKKNLFEKYLDELQEKDVIEEPSEDNDSVFEPKETKIMSLSSSEDDSENSLLQTCLEMNNHYFMDELQDKIIFKLKSH